ncbi:hypothetical protein KJ807_05535 [Patescibacteria group bacterium]|nr:hypothetical protein [Patescibacteria group bacterium]
MKCALRNKSNLSGNMITVIDGKKYRTCQYTGEVFQHAPFKIPHREPLKGWVGTYCCPSVCLAAMIDMLHTPGPKNEYLTEERHSEMLDQLQHSLRRTEFKSNVRFDVKAAPKKDLLKRFAKEGNPALTWDEYKAEIDYDTQIKMFEQHIQDIPGQPATKRRERREISRWFVDIVESTGQHTVKAKVDVGMPHQYSAWRDFLLSLSSDGRPRYIVFHARKPTTFAVCFVDCYSDGVNKAATKLMGTTINGPAFVFYQGRVDVSKSKMRAAALQNVPGTDKETKRQRETVESSDVDNKRATKRARENGEWARQLEEELESVFEEPYIVTDETPAQEVLYHSKPGSSGKVDLLEEASRKMLL